MIPAPTPLHLVIAFVVAFIAGGINSVAGGGSMISFPVLIALGLPPLFANATNTVGIWPGAIGSLWGFKRELARIPKSYFWIAIPALFGSVGGAILLRFTSPETFERIVPGLIIFSTVLFIVAPSIRKRLRLLGGDGDDQQTGMGRWAVVMALQLLVAIYGGYFGAGMSILMLSILSLIGMSDMLEMNALTSLLSLVINGAAGVIFIFAGLISWPIALAMSVGAITGGYLAAGIARKVGNEWIRRLVITVGFTLAAVMLVKVLRG